MNRGNVKMLYYAGADMLRRPAFRDTLIETCPFKEIDGGIVDILHASVPKIIKNIFEQA